MDIVGTVSIVIAIIGLIIGFIQLVISIADYVKTHHQ